jgi:copper(I)-binding protein
MPKPGWKVATEKGPYAGSYKYFHGGPRTEGVKRVTWSGGELLDEHFDQFVLAGYVARELQPGTLYFPVTQKCVEGELSWNQIPAAGQSAHDLEHPAAALQLVAAESGGHDHHAHAGAGDIMITGAWSRPVASAGGVGVGYMKIDNKGGAGDVLTGGSTDVAERLELHETTIDDKGVAAMKKVDRLDIAPGKSVELKPGGLHIMLMGLKQPLKEGEKVKATLEFEKAGPVEVELTVNAGGAAASDDAHHHHHH